MRKMAVGLMALALFAAARCEAKPVNACAEAYNSAALFAQSYAAIAPEGDGQRWLEESAAFERAAEYVRAGDAGAAGELCSGARLNGLRVVLENMHARADRLDPGRAQVRVVVGNVDHWLSVEGKGAR